MRAIVGGLVRLLLRFYFRRIERFHAERVPAEGPVLFVSNHPGSVTDAFIVGTSVPRQVHFIGTVQLFKAAWVAKLLKSCGVIPINRKADDPKAMRSVAATFEACYQVLEEGGAVGIFPEGVSYDDAQLREVKSGAARMALELESRHGGKLGLRIAPVGLTYAAKEKYRSEVLVHFGHPIVVADYLANYERDRKETIRALTAAIEQHIRDLILSLPTLEQARLVEAIKQLYLDRLRLGNLVVIEPMAPQAEELVLTQAIGEALAFFAAKEPGRLSAFVDDLHRYERRLRQFGLSDETIEHLSRPHAIARNAGATARIAVFAPFAAYGWMHRLIPALLVEWAVRHFTHKDAPKAQTPLAAMLAGFVVFTIFYGLCVLAVWWIGGPKIALAYALSLPVASLIAHYHLRWLRNEAGDLRAVTLLRRLPLAKRVLVQMRQHLIDQLTDLRAEYRRTGLGIRTTTVPEAPPPA